MSDNTTDHVCCPCLREEQRWREQQRLKLLEWRLSRLSNRPKHVRNLDNELTHVLDLALGITWAFHQIQHFQNAQAKFLEYDIKNPALQARMKAILADARAVRDRFRKHVESILDGPLPEIAEAVDKEIDAGRAPLAALFRLTEMAVDANNVLFNIDTGDFDRDYCEITTPEDRLHSAAIALKNEILAREATLQK